MKLINRIVSEYDVSQRLKQSVFKQIKMLSNTTVFPEKDILLLVNHILAFALGYNIGPCYAFKFLCSINEQKDKRIKELEERIKQLERELKCSNKTEARL